MNTQVNSSNIALTKSVVSQNRDPPTISGFRRQLAILLWKNAILLKRNVIGTIFELGLSIFFVFTLVIIRYIVERYRYDQQMNPTYYVIDFFRNLADHNLLLFYPNTPVVSRIVNHAYDLIKSRKQWANLTGIMRHFDYLLIECFKSY
jgi:hypothetical protein